MTPPYLPFVDWLKALGLALIVYGHVAASSTVSWTPPVYPKQLGVAFFVFVTGFTLASEGRNRWRVVYNRFFEVGLFGLVFALMMSVVGLSLHGDANESNYMPLALGVHMLMNDFPANPTTWYIGTYLHLLLLWALLLRNVRVTVPSIAAAVVLEVATRTVAIVFQVPFIGYMSVLNWTAVLMLGLFAGGHTSEGLAQGGLLQRHNAGRPSTTALIAALAVPPLWAAAMALVGWERSFPFMNLGAHAGITQAAFTSIAVSACYLFLTSAVYVVARRLPDVWIVRWLARSSVIIFIAHMPVYYALEYYLIPVIPDYALRVSIEFVLCLGGLGVASVLIRQILRPNVLREMLAQRVDRRLHPPPSLSLRA